MTTKPPVRKPYLPHSSCEGVSPRAVQFCTTPDGVRIAYSLTGRGAPIVKACMWLNDIESELTSPVWRPWISLLSSGHELIAHDLRGCGLSDRGAVRISLNDWVGDLETVVDAAGLERFVLVGVSQGGATAIEYASRHPDRVAGLVLCGAYLQGALKRATTQAERERAEALAKLVEFGWGVDHNPVFRQLFSARFFPGGSAEQIRWMNDHMASCTTPDMAARIMRAMYEIDVRASAARVACPTLVMHSRGDDMVPFESGRLVAGAIPGARFVPLESRSHLPMTSEAAWQVVRSEVLSFLDRVEGGAAGGEDSPVLAGLTVREREVLEHVARGAGNAAIAQRMGLATKTVRNYVSTLLDKLGVASRGEAIVVARDAGLGRTR